MLLKTNLLLISLSLLSVHLTVASGPENWPKEWVEETLPDGSIKKTMYLNVPGMGKVVSAETITKKSVQVTKTESSSTQKSKKTSIIGIKKGKK